MSALGRLKARLATTDTTSVGSGGEQGTHVAPRPSDLFVGFDGDPSTRVSDAHPVDQPFVGSVGDQGISFPGFEPTLIAEIPLPHPPTKPTEPIRRSELRNSLRLYLPQIDTTRCLVCAEREDADQPFVPICTAAPGRHHWLHAACWPEHCRRMEERVAVVMRGAGIEQDTKPGRSA